MTRVYILFYLFLAGFLLNQALFYLQVELPLFFSSYLNDLLCMPIVLTICMFIIQKIKKEKMIKFSLFTVFSLAAFYAVYFELYLPKVKERYTADYIDVFLYFSGAFLFYLAQNRKTSAKNISAKNDFQQ